MIEAETLDPTSSPPPNDGALPQHPEEPAPHLRPTLLERLHIHTRSDRLSPTREKEPKPRKSKSPFRRSGATDRPDSPDAAPPVPKLKVKPSYLSVKTSSMKRSFQGEQSAAPQVPAPMTVEPEPKAMKVEIPKFLDLTRPQISSRFHDLEWKQRFRLVHALQNTDSPWMIDKSPIVIARNRYSNIQPWANSRIRLKVAPGQSDYVNASPISLKDSKGNQTESRYIATQGPKDTSHFWHMVFQETQEPAVVIMLTQTHEGNREKCAQYYPLSTESPKVSLPVPETVESSTEKTIETHDPFIDTTEPPLPPGTLTLLSVEQDPQSRTEIRKLTLTIGTESKTVYHYLFTGWADFGKPEGAERQALLELIKQTSIRAGNLATNPRIVHCSAGVGRTGTFIALDYLLQELESGAMEGSPRAQMAKTVKGLNLNDKETNGKGKGKLKATVKGDAKNDGKDDSDGNNLVINDEGSPPQEFSFPSSKDDGPEEAEDLIYQTVNLLREQRMMMVMNELQYWFIYEVLRERFLARYQQNTQTVTSLPVEDQMMVDEERSPKIARKGPVDWGSGTSAEGNGTETGTGVGSGSGSGTGQEFYADTDVEKGKAKQTADAGSG